MVLVLNLSDLRLVVLEQNCILGMQVVLEVVSVQNCLELSQQLKTVFDVGNHFEVLVDVLLQRCLN